MPQVHNCSGRTCPLRASGSTPAASYPRIRAGPRVSARAFGSPPGPS